MIDRSLEGHNVVVTGTARGIGRATCEAIAVRGGNVWATMRAPDASWEAKLGQLAQQHGVVMTPVYVDVTNPDQVKALFGEIKRSDRPLTGLVNNAGLTLNAIFQMTSDRDARALFETNVFGVMSMMQGAVRLMTKSRSGSIVNVSSTAAIDANKGRSVYGATKAAVSTLTKGAARELAPIGIRVNAVAPGITDTDMLDTMTDEVLAEIETSLDLRRRGRTDEIASAIAFLLSPRSSYLSGQTIRVDGGMHQ